MTAIEHLKTWEHPRDYGGFSPEGDYVITSKNRDSDSLTRSNWECIGHDMSAEAYDDGTDGFESRPTVYHWRAGHWACGWVEYMMVRADAPKDILAKADEILRRLDVFPVYDEHHWSALEWDEACEYWERMSISDRVELIRRANNGISIFAARHDYIPEDPNGALIEYLRG